MRNVTQSGTKSVSGMTMNGLGNKVASFSTLMLILFLAGCTKGTRSCGRFLIYRAAMQKL